jgi:hypothetical protein
LSPSVYTDTGDVCGRSSNKEQLAATPCWSCIVPDWSEVRKDRRRRMAQSL